jgi:hypothetical protein
MKLYNYPTIKGVYIIKKNNKLYNVLDSDQYDSNSFLKGGIILKSHKTNKTSFPHNLMMNGLEDYEIKETSNGKIYDGNVWNEEEINSLNIPEEKNVLPQTNIGMNIELIEDVMKEVDNIKKLYKNDDNTLKSQWFMDYVIFDKQSPPSIMDNFRNREYKINKSIQKLNELSQYFEINNNHQMKLWFKIFFDLEDTSVADTNFNLKENFTEPSTVRTDQLNKQLKEAEEEAKTNAPATLNNVENALEANNALEEAKANASATINNLQKALEVNNALEEAKANAPATINNLQKALEVNNLNNL